MITVLCHGCFDIYHYGHSLHFKDAIRYGDILVVSVTHDDGVGKGTGRPIFPHEIRADLIRGLTVVDRVIISKSAAEAIRNVRPQVYAKGSDYTYDALLPDEKKALKDVGATAVFTKTQKLSSTEILNRLIKGA